MTIVDSGNITNAPKFLKNPEITEKIKLMALGFRERLCFGEMFWRSYVKLFLYGKIKFLKLT